MADLNINAGPNMQADPASKKSLLRGFIIAIALLIAAAIFAVSYYMSGAEEKRFENDLRNDIEKYTYGKSIAIKSWLNSLVEQGARISQQDMFTLFADQVEQLGDSSAALTDTNSQRYHELTEKLDTQRMRNLLQDFVKDVGFLSGRMVTSKGVTALSTESVPPLLTNEQTLLIKQVVESGKTVFGPIHKTVDGLALDFCMPVFPYQYEAKNSKPVAVLMFSKALGTNIEDILSAGQATRIPGTAFVLQRTGTDFQIFGMAGSSKLLDVKPAPIGPSGELSFALRAAVEQGNAVYSQGSHVEGQDWWVVDETNAERARVGLANTVRNIYIVASLCSLVVLLAFGVTAWWAVGRQQKQALCQVQDLFSVIEKQKRLLDGINGTISDPISLTDPNGTYIYVNRAFAQSVGREPSEVPGLDTSAVFGFDTAKRLNASDQHVMMTGDGITTTETIWLQSRKHLFQISKTPLRETGSRTPRGIVSVFRDLTQVMEAEEKSHRVVQQTIDALVRAIEEADPFLGGHSRIMSGIAELMGRTMHFSDIDLATIQAAANLSQIGKMFVPREILTKPGALTTEEKKLMEQHVEHTKDLVANIEFDLPVADAIYQMHERLDGKGYPQGLQEKDINIYARVLSVANAFTAMARPRSYRPAIPVDEALNALEKQTGAFDLHVVNVLREVLNTPAGERYIQMAASSKAV